MKGRLLVSHSNGLELFDVSTPGSSRQVNGLEMEGVRGMEIPALSSVAASVLVEQERGHFALVNVSGERPEVAAHYHQRPWFAGTASVDGITVRGTQHGVVDIFIQGRRATHQF